MASVLPALVVMAVVVASGGCGVATRGEEAAAVAAVGYPVSDLNEYLATVDPASAAAVPRSAAAAWLSEWVFFTALTLELADRATPVTSFHHEQAVVEVSAADPSFDRSAVGSDVTIARQAAVVAAQQWALSQVPEVTEADLDELDAPRIHCSKHILVASRPEADAVLDRLAAGEDFADLAAELSLDPGSAYVGGSLGCVLEGAFVAAFEEAVFAAPAGEPVAAESQFGVHVIDVVSAGPATPGSHPQLDPEQVLNLQMQARARQLQDAQTHAQQHRQQLLADLVDDVLANYAHQVTVNSRYGTWDPDNFVVTAGAGTAAGPA